MFAPLIFALFSTGSGGRHDWLRFHADDVPCPDEECYGNLKWTASDRKELVCDQCRARFSVTLKKGKT